MTERRQTGRFVPSDEMVGRIRAAIPARIVDVSIGGAQLELDSTGLRPGSECRLELPAEGGTVQLLARVQRCRVAGTRVAEDDEHVVVYRAGLQFLDPGDEELERLVLGFRQAEESGEDSDELRALQLNVDPDDLTTGGDEPGRAGVD